MLSGAAALPAAGWEPAGWLAAGFVGAPVGLVPPPLQASASAVRTTMDVTFQLRVVGPMRLPPATISVPDPPARRCYFGMLHNRRMSACYSTEEQASPLPC